MMSIDRMELQLFATEKTEKATPKKRKDARDKGQVFKSHELSSAAIVLLIFGMLRLIFPFMLENLQDIYKKYLTMGLPLEQIYSAGGIRNLGLDVMFTMGVVAAPVALLALVSGLAINYWQVGFLFTTSTMAIKLERLNPIEGFKRIFSIRALAEFLKSMLKVVIVTVIAYYEYMAVIRNLPRLMQMSVIDGVTFIGNSTFRMVLSMGLGLLVLSTLDYCYQWWEYEKSLRMSKQEIKDEYKQMEGDPQIRSKVKEKQKQMGMSRMMQQVPKADVVITNPVHFAVALKYEPSLNDAPMVIAKGQERVALNIKKIAALNDVAIVENPPLAQALFGSAEIGQAIPAELFQAVAEVLAFVYNIKGKRPG